MHAEVVHRNLKLSEDEYKEDDQLYIHLLLLFILLYSLIWQGIKQLCSLAYIVFSYQCNAFQYTLQYINVLDPMLDLWTDNPILICLGS